MPEGRCVEKIVMGSSMDIEDSMLYIKALEQGTGDINWMFRLSKGGIGRAGIANVQGGR